MTKAKYRILIADDHSLLRMGLSLLISYQSDMTVVGEAEDGVQAVALARKLKPDLVIMDLMMPEMNGAAATKAIRQDLPETKVCILTSFGNSADILHAVVNGASGAMLKDLSSDALLDAFRKILNGKRYIPAEIEQLLEESATPVSLTVRQQEILSSAARGFSTEDMAKQFAISPDGVKKHFAAIFNKLGATTRSEAVAIALRKHLLKI